MLGTTDAERAALEELRNGGAGGGGGHAEESESGELHFDIGLKGETELRREDVGDLDV